MNRIPEVAGKEDMYFRINKISPKENVKLKINYCLLYCWSLDLEKGCVGCRLGIACES